MDRVKSLVGRFDNNVLTEYENGELILVDWLNRAQDELVNIIEGFGRVLDPNRNDQIASILTEEIGSIGGTVTIPPALSTTEDLEIEFMTMSFNSISWAQFAISDPLSSSICRENPEPGLYPASLSANCIKASGTLPLTDYIFTSKTFQNITTIESGTCITSGSNKVQDLSKDWFIDEVRNLKLIDSNDIEFSVISNTTNELTLNGNPTPGSYYLRDGLPTYFIAFCAYKDSTWHEGFGFVKMEVSFNAGANWRTVLDTQHGVDELQGTIAVGTYTGRDYKVRLTLTTDSQGRTPYIYRYLVGTDPSPWRF